MANLPSTKVEVSAAQAVDQAGKALYGFDPEAVETIKNTVAKGATNHELALFLYTASKLGLDPLLQQIWFVKYGTGQPSIQVGRDGLLAIAQRDPGYESVVSQAVYSKDEFEMDVTEGKVRHIIRNPAERGVLIGAYAIAPHKERKPVVSWVSYQEYAQSWGQKNPVWKTNPAEMIRKVAESQSLRRQYASTGISAVYIKDEYGSGVEEPNGAAEKPTVSKEEIDSLIHEASKAGLSWDQIIDAFQAAANRITFQGWSRDRAEFEKWREKIQEAIEANKTVAAEPEYMEPEPQVPPQPAEETQTRQESPGLFNGLDEETSKAKEEPRKPGAPAAFCSICGARISERVLQYSQQHFGQPLCVKCQKAQGEAKEAAGQ